MKGLSGDSEGFPGGREVASAEEARACDACGARARRAGARFCATCGRVLGGGYFPADSLRASYRFERVPSAAVRGAARRAPRRSSSPPAARPRAGRDFMSRERARSGAAATAFAFAAYGLVPYLGILFCPGALLFGGIGLVRAWRTPGAGRDARASAQGLALGLLVLCGQLVLWWILYKVPEWAARSPY